MKPRVSCVDVDALGSICIYIRCGWYTLQWFWSVLILRCFWSISVHESQVAHC